MMFHNDLLRWCANLAAQVNSRLTAAVSGIAFWTGILSPLLYLPFIIPGVKTEGRFVVFLTLIVVNYLALLLGYSYKNQPDT